MAHATYISRGGAGAMIVRRLCAPCAVTLLLLATQAPALQIRWDGAYYNPSPESGDVILPMPCGGTMAFHLGARNSPDTEPSRGSSPFWR